MSIEVSKLYLSMVSKHEKANNFVLFYNTATHLLRYLDTFCNVRIKKNIIRNTLLFYVYVSDFEKVSKFLSLAVCLLNLCTCKKQGIEEVPKLLRYPLSLVVLGGGEGIVVGLSGWGRGL